MSSDDRISVSAIDSSEPRKSHTRLVKVGGVAAILAGILILARKESALWQAPMGSSPYRLAPPFGISSGISVDTASLDTSRAASPTASSYNRSASSSSSRRAALTPPP
jgi:hypothetical protein